MAAVTPTTLRALEIISRHSVTSPRQFGRLMWPDNAAWKFRSKCGPNGVSRGGGMNLAGGAYLGKLRQRGLINGGHNGRPYYLTETGEAALKEAAVTVMPPPES